MRTDLLTEALDVLKLLKQELSNNVEDCVIQELDHVIELLEEESKNSSKAKSQEVIALIGTVVRRLPSIISIIDRLSG
jgi:hypothetical protein